MQAAADQTAFARTRQRFPPPPTYLSPTSPVLPVPRGSRLLMWYQREGSVQTAQRGQVKARTVKRPAANILLGFPSEGKLRPQAVMRCSAIARYEAYCYFFRLKTVPLAEPTPQSAVVPQAELPDTFPSEGKAERTTFARIRKLSPLCTQPLSLASPVLPVLRGVSGGGAALSSLCRRFPGGDIMNLTSRRNPLSGLSFSLFFFLRERKRGYRQRRSHKIPATKAKPASPKHCSIVSQIPRPVNRASHTRSQCSPGLQSPSPCQAR